MLFNNGDHRCQQPRKIFIQRPDYNPVILNFLNDVGIMAYFLTQIAKYIYGAFTSIEQSENLSNEVDDKRRYQEETTSLQ
jgi:hypothetical protein